MCLAFTLQYHPLHFCIFYLEGDVTVQDDVIVTVDPKCDGNATLTCISTGGPATNVTWTRNSKEVLGGISVLMDIMEARYTHILTLEERQGGLYQCVVSNNKPSESNASILLKGTLDYYHIIVYYVCISIPPTL